MSFDLVKPYEPAGDQPRAIAELLKRLQQGERHNTLLGVTGSGKTFTVANVIQAIDRPTLVISHNKTLAAQLFSEFKQFFPNNAVEYFVSYFDYYQPEAYIPQTDTYIEKDSSVNEEIERLRLSATSSLLTRKDVIVVASVSCIYGLGSPEDFENMVLPLQCGQHLTRDNMLARLIDIQYERNDIALTRGKFRVRGDVVEIALASDENGLRVEFFGDEIDAISQIDLLTGETLQSFKSYSIFPARHFVTPHEKLRRALVTIQQELEERITELEKHNKYLEAQRIKMRTTYDLEMMQELGYCNGIENYSRHLTGRPPGSRPFTLLDFFPKDFLLVVDESHVSIPQIGGMYEGDQSRKRMLVEHGFRLPSALDNRPLNFKEFESLFHQVIYVSATPGKFELGKTHGKIIEQIVRPTGLLDPIINIQPITGQIDTTINETRKRIECGERVLITTLTKRTSEDLAEYLRDAGFKVRYLHSEIDAIERVEILRELRNGEVDVLVGINLLREGLDLPEVSLVCILDADKEGFLRSETSLIQTSGRAARHINGEVILFADKMTDSIRKFLEISNYRRKKQIEHNQKNNIQPTTVKRAVQESLKYLARGSENIDKTILKNSDIDVAQTIAELEKEMWEASTKFEYERAALLRDQIRELKSSQGLIQKQLVPAPKKSVKYRKRTPAKKQKN
jgi:excinuclease ABC subunit B